MGNGIVGEWQLIIIEKCRIHIDFKIGKDYPILIISKVHVSFTFLFYENSFHPWLALLNQFIFSISICCNR